MTVNRAEHQPMYPPLAEECGAAVSHAYLMVHYMPWLGNEVGTVQQYLGDEVPTPEAALEQADDFLRVKAAADQPPRKPYRAAAVTLLSLCLEHKTEPQMEVIANVIAVPTPRQEPRMVQPEGQLHISRVGGLWAAYVWPATDAPRVFGSGRSLVHFLARPDFDGARNNAFPLVDSFRGGESSAVTFGLLGDEVLIPREVGEGERSARTVPAPCN